MLDIQLKTCYNTHMINERIKLLAEQATTYIDPIANDGVCWAFDKEKFAQLIVAECAEVILKTFVVHNEIDAMHRIRDRVKEHFGVTE
jgi:hypothetical protein